MPNLHMISKQIEKSSFVAFWGFILVSLLCVVYAWYSEDYILFAVPAALMIAYFTFIDFKSVYYFLLFLIPCSIEFQVTPSLGTDLPTEPLIVGIMIAFFIYIAFKPKSLDYAFVSHPVMVFILLQLCWTFVAAINSINTEVSFKYILAKIWYLTTFLFATSVFIRTQKDITRFIWLFFTPLSILIIVTLIRYIPYNFAFEEVNKTMVPYFRNKVNYGTTLTIFLPYILLLIRWQKPGSFLKKLLIVSVPLYIIGIYFSYTRSCILALLVCIIAYMVIRLNLLKPAMIAALAGVIVMVSFLVHKNEFMNYAPVFEKTIQHDKYEDHLTATVSLEDVSSMERVFMWIGGAYMFLEHPVNGSGSNTFFPNYKHYTVHSFETYMSDNEEKLSVHNYFLLTLIEQGIVGLLLFIIVIYIFLSQVQKYYHLAKSKYHKQVLMACAISFIAIMVNITLSDLLEVDKIGSIYYISIAIAITICIQVRREITEQETLPIDSLAKDV